MAVEFAAMQALAWLHVTVPRLSLLGQGNQAASDSRLDRQPPLPHHLFPSLQQSKGEDESPYMYSAPHAPDSVKKESGGSLPSLPWCELSVGSPSPGRPLSPPNIARRFAGRAVTRVHTVFFASVWGLLLSRLHRSRDMAPVARLEGWQPKYPTRTAPCASQLRIRQQGGKKKGKEDVQGTESTAAWASAPIQPI